MLGGRAELRGPPGPSAARKSPLNEAGSPGCPRRALSGTAFCPSQMVSASFSQPPQPGKGGDRTRESPKEHARCAGSGRVHRGSWAHLRARDPRSRRAGSQWLRSRSCFEPGQGSRRTRPLKEAGPLRRGARFLGGRVAVRSRYQASSATGDLAGSGQTPNEKVDAKSVFPKAP